MYMLSTILIFYHLYRLLHTESVSPLDLDVLPVDSTSIVDGVVQQIEVRF